MQKNRFYIFCFIVLGFLLSAACASNTTPDASGDDDDSTTAGDDDSTATGDDDDDTTPGTSDEPTTDESTYRYHAANGKIYKDDSEIALLGLNWFGFETSSYVPHGLWARPYGDMLDDIQALGFNALRVPFCPGALTTDSTADAQEWNNPELEGLNNLELFDFFLNEFNDRSLYFVLDHHRPDCSAISELWYTVDYTEDDWLADLEFIANRYKDLEYFVGIDLKNEPHGAATWGTGDVSTDWNTAAEKAAERILAVNDDILIFVEGIQESSLCSTSEWSHWWGGNLEPIDCYPLDIETSKLVLSPHVYGPDVYAQSYFDSGTDFSQMSEIWGTHFGFAKTDLDYTLAIGEFGGKYGEADATDDEWQQEFVDYLIANEICDFFFWSWNPNSGDTGGIVGDDWVTVKTDKYNNLKRLMDSCQ